MKESLTTALVVMMTLIGTRSLADYAGLTGTRSAWSSAGYDAATGRSNI